MSAWLASLKGVLPKLMHTRESHRTLLLSVRVMITAGLPHTVFWAAALVIEFLVYHLLLIAPKKLGIALVGCTLQDESTAAPFQADNGQIFLWDQDY